MSVQIVEIKAKTDRLDELRSIILSQNARTVGTDHQVDTYYVVPKGRLKLRHGPIENTLIFYQRADTAAAKTSEVELYKSEDLASLKPLLDAAFDQLVTVRKRREIFFIENVKLHLDIVEGLGTFVEIEAIDESGTIDVTTLNAQCTRLMQLLDIRPDDLQTHSYSDMLLQNK